jgi:hypothetical protein
VLEVVNGLTYIHSQRRPELTNWPLIRISRESKNDSGLELRNSAGVNGGSGAEVGIAAVRQTGVFRMLADPESGSHLGVWLSKH